MKKILIVTDTCSNQVNGVIRTLQKTKENLEVLGYEIFMLTPDALKGFYLPNYKEIKITYNFKNVKKQILDFDPDYIHIATEGTLGLYVNILCRIKEWNFTTSYHTKFDDYLKEYHGIPRVITRFYLRYFHKKSKKILVPTKSMKDYLSNFKFKNIFVWGRGVDRDLFNLNYEDLDFGKRPYFLNVGRVSKEKNLDKFLELQITGTKIIVGDGPLLEKYKKKYKDVIFLGKKEGTELAQIYKSCDVFVFPSLTDTAGIVQLEANSCGLPIAAYPVIGPIDFIENGINGVMLDNLHEAVLKCLLISNKKKIYNYAERFDWKECTKVFEINLVKK